MTKLKKDLKAELKSLCEHGKFLLYDIAISENKLSEEQIKIVQKRKGYEEFKKSLSSYKSAYQEWFTKSYNIVKQIIPDRANEFYSLYKNDKRKEIDYLTYTISDFFLGLIITKGWEKIEVVNPFNAFFSKMEIQLSILNACYKLIDYKLANIEGVLQYELFENELHASKDLLNKKYIRVAGCLSGVTLETHLSSVCKNHGIKFKKLNPTISDFNEELKKLNIIDIPTWRLIQRLADIRNMSAHSKERDPTRDEVEDLIKGVEKLIAEVN